MTDEFVLLRFGASFCIGLLMGLVRERNPLAQAGVRTYALVAALGTMAGLLHEKGFGPWMLPAGIVTLGWMMVRATQRGAIDGDAGTTSTVAVLLCFAVGVMVWTGPLAPAVMIGLVATLLLHFKTELEGFALGLSAPDVASILRFGVLTVLILPLLPDQAMGPFGALNPRQIWWMVVLISGIGLGGYLCLKLFGTERGSIMSGALGGLVSSTATTLAFARRFRSDAVQLDAARTVIVLATIVALARLAVFAALLSPSSLPMLAPMFIGGFAAGLLSVLVGIRHMRERHVMEIDNPGELRTAIGFALIFALMQLGTAWLEQRYGDRGLYVAALASGAVDLDAIAMSVLHRHALGGFDVLTVERCLAIAYSASLVSKSALALAAGGRSLGLALLGPFAMIAFGLLLGSSIG